VDAEPRGALTRFLTRRFALINPLAGPYSSGYRFCERLESNWVCFPCSELFLFFGVLQSHVHTISG
jgi:hypothetical protein